MTILVTGATGFIGRNFVHTYHSECRAVTRKGVRHQFPDYHEIDSLTGATDWQGAFNGVDVIVHFAGLAHSDSFTNEDYVRVNTNGTLHLAREAAKAGVRRFVFMSSIGVNGSTSKGAVLKAADIPNPSNDYSKSKLLAENGLKEIGRKTGMEIVIIRPVLVYGAGAPGNFGLLTKLVKWTSILPFGLVKNKRNFISVNNLSDFVATCIVHPNAANQTFIISDGDAVSTAEFIGEMALSMGRNVFQVPIPVVILLIGGCLIGKYTQIRQLVDDFEVDSSLSRTKLNWAPVETMREAMQDSFQRIPRDNNC